MKYTPTLNAASLILLLVLLGCGKSALTPEELAKRHPGGTPLTQDEQQQLQASLSPRDYLAFKRKFEMLARYSGQASQQDRATAANEQHQKALQQLITTPRTLSASERKLVGTWVTTDVFLTEAPAGVIEARIRLDEDGLGTVTLTNLQTKETETQRAAWQATQDRLKLKNETSKNSIAEHDFAFFRKSSRLNLSWPGGAAKLIGR